MIPYRMNPLGIAESVYPPDLIMYEPFDKYRDRTLVGKWQLEWRDTTGDSFTFETLSGKRCTVARNGSTVRFPVPFVYPDRFTMSVWHNHRGRYYACIGRWLANNDSFCFSCQSNANQGYTAFSGVPIGFFTFSEWYWHCIQITYDNRALNFYVDGTRVTGGTMSRVPPLNTDFLILSVPVDNLQTDYFACCDFRMYNRVLSESELSEVRQTSF